MPSRPARLALASIIALAVKYWLNAIDCRSKSLCVATGADGVSVSTRPLGGSSSWQTTTVDSSGGELEDVSCPSTGLCVAVDNHGFAVVGQP
jgi:hypothetical protein